MRLRNVKNATQILNDNINYLGNPKEYKGKYKTLFNNDNPIHIEIGMGKGDFLIGMAKKYPNINFIGIEKYESVLVRAAQKMAEQELTNTRIMSIDAITLNEIFEREIEAIYLNFSDPWPKNRHRKRRLTSSDFLKVYEQIFKDKKTIIQKTDDITLFASSLEDLSQFGYTFERVSLDLHNEDLFNVKTEYEEKFSKRGYKINYLVAKKD